jgi:hypothetical protein
MHLARHETVRQCQSPGGHGHREAPERATAAGGGFWRARWVGRCELGFRHRRPSVGPEPLASRFVTGATSVSLTCPVGRTDAAAAKPDRTGPSADRPPRRPGFRPASGPSGLRRPSPRHSVSEATSQRRRLVDRRCSAIAAATDPKPSARGSGEPGAVQRLATAVSESRQFAEERVNAAARRATPVGIGRRPAAFRHRGNRKPFSDPCVEPGDGPCGSHAAPTPGPHNPRPRPRRPRQDWAVTPRCRCAR